MSAPWSHDFGFSARHSSPHHSVYFPKGSLSLHWLQYFFQTYHVALPKPKKCTREGTAKGTRISRARFRRSFCDMQSFPPLSAQAWQGCTLRMKRNINLAVPHKRQALWEPWIYFQISGSGIRPCFAGKQAHPCKERSKDVEIEICPRLSPKMWIWKAGITL